MDGLWDRVGEVIRNKRKGQKKEKKQKKRRQRKASRIIIAALEERTGLLNIDKKKERKYDTQEIGNTKTQARASPNIFRVSQQNHEGNGRAKLWINGARRKGGKNKRSGRDETYFQPICS